MSQALISAGVAGRPTPGYFDWAKENIGSNAIRTRARGRPLVNLDIRHLPALGHAPRLDGVVVVDRARASHRAQLVDLGLHVAGLVDRARLQHRGAAVPDPAHIEAREALGLRRALEPRRRPVATAVERNVDALDPAAPAPRE